jgi:hypothetical protein
VREQRLVDAVLQHRALAHEVQAEARALAGAAGARVRQPDLGHELAAAELGQQARVDAVGLDAGLAEHLGRDPGHGGVGDPHLEPLALELVVHEARARHRLDDDDDLLAEREQPARERGQPVAVGRRRAGGAVAALGPERVPVQALATEVSSHVQHH